MALTTTELLPHVVETEMRSHEATPPRECESGCCGTGVGTGGNGLDRKETKGELRRKIAFGVRRENAQRNRRGVAVGRRDRPGLHERRKLPSRVDARRDQKRCGDQGWLNAAVFVSRREPEVDFGRFPEQRAEPVTESWPKLDPATIAGRQGRNR